MYAPHTRSRAALGDTRTGGVRTRVVTSHASFLGVTRHGVRQGASCPEDMFYTIQRRCKGGGGTKGVRVQRPVFLFPLSAGLRAHSPAPLVTRLDPFSELVNSTTGSIISTDRINKKLLHTNRTRHRSIVRTECMHFLEGRAGLSLAGVRDAGQLDR